jgi:hypothetical protein
MLSNSWTTIVFYLRKGNQMLIFFYILMSLFPFSAVIAEIDLSLYESSLYSPNGEDGVIARIFASIQTSQKKYCVECGASDGINNSLTYLLRNQGWQSLLLDKAFEIPAFNLHKAFITAENINALFEKYNVPENFDFLAINLGYNDFYIWKSIDNRYQPKVVCIAYNSHFGPMEDKIVHYHPYFCGDDTQYFGASILAFFNLGLAKGYTLVYAEETGQHLFFVRDDVIEKNQLQFKNANNVNSLYRASEYDLKISGHRRDPRNRKYLSSNEILME